MFNKKPFFKGLHAIPSGGLTPGQVCKAYNFKQLTPVRQIKIGIVSLDGIYSDSDMKTAFAAYNLPAPKVTVAGPQGSDTNATVENMLDIECAGAAYAFSTGQSAVIIEQFEVNNSVGIPKAINALVAAGCEVISISWGGPADEQSPTSNNARAKACAAAAAANVHIFAASGDDSLDDGTNSRTPDDPCCDPNVWGVGGTRLKSISQAQLQSLLYKNRKTAFNDITIGSDGEPAVVGWDEATGCGSINGPGMAAALTGVQ